MSSQHAWNQVLAEVAIEAGQAVVAAVTAVPLDQRSQKQKSVLKPPPGLAAVPDCVGEDAAFAILQQLASRLACEVRVIIDQHNYHSIKPTCAIFQHVWTYLDAVDGTVKVAGLGNEPGRLRAANDGSWAVGIALSYPTGAELQDLKLSDFKVAAIVDGALSWRRPGGDNSSVQEPYPSIVVAAWQQDTGAYHTFQGSLSGPRLYTTTNTVLNQSFVYLDAFQAFDRSTQHPGDEALATSLYALLINRHEGGAFDVLRTYGNLAALQRTMLGWQESPTAQETAACESTTGGVDRPASHSWLESQTGGMVVVNENHANLIPAVPIILGAGGIATDFQERELSQRRLAEGRCNVLFAANQSLHGQLLAVITRAAATSQQRE